MPWISINTFLHNSSQILIKDFLKHFLNERKITNLLLFKIEANYSDSSSIIEGNGMVVVVHLAKVQLCWREIIEQALERVRLIRCAARVVPDSKQFSLYFVLAK